MVEFIRVSEVFGRMMVACSRASLGAAAPTLTDKQIDEIAEYNAAKQEYQTITARYAERDREAANGMLKFRESKGETITPLPKLPPKPKPSKHVLEFLNLVEALAGTSISKAAKVIEAYAAQGDLRTFSEQSDGTYKRYPSDRYGSIQETREYPSGQLVWTGWNWGGDSFPIAILKDDYEYFMQHGEPRPLEQSSETPQKSRGLDYSIVIEKMRRAIKSDASISIPSAAALFIDDIPSRGGSDESRIKAAERKYLKKYPND
tara:strand:- start:276 stop:1058 length:783 start_codon:yes stop_codon:yes gene_type:complete